MQNFTSLSYLLWEITGKGADVERPLNNILTNTHPGTYKSGQTITWYSVSLG